MQARDDYERGALDAVSAGIDGVSDLVHPRSHVANRFRHGVALMIRARRKISREAEDFGAEDVA